MKALKAPCATAHSQAKKKAMSALTMDSSSGRGSVAGGLGQARISARVKAQANISRATTGVGGERSSQ